LIYDIDEVKLPEVIRDGLVSRGYVKLTPPQYDALRRGLLNFKNVVVIAPTASGKTLIAEVALVNAYLNGGMGIYTSPLKALAYEKFIELKFWEHYGLRVGISTGDFDEVGESLGRYDIVVTTYERLDSLLRHKPSWLRRVKTLVIDELHYVNDVERGPIIEVIGARALMLGIQVVGLSATVGSPQKLSKWLRAELVLSDWRPVRLIEGYYDRSSNSLVFLNGRVEHVSSRDPIEHIVVKAMKENYQVLIFKQSRRLTESLARKLAKVVYKYLSFSDRVELGRLARRLSEESSSKLEVESLKPLIMNGVAYHHAGLSLAARRVIEDGFRAKLIKVVAATPTLAAGINVPARRVLIYTARYSRSGYDRITVTEYKQMAGRAGRPQYDPYGEAIIMDLDEDEVKRYLRGDLEEVISKLRIERALRIHVLATIASGYARTVDDVAKFFSNTLLAIDYSERSIVKNIRNVVKTLYSIGMLRSIGDEIVPTELGDVVSKLYIDPVSATRVINLMYEVSEAPTIYYLHTLTLTPDFARVRVGSVRRGLEDEALMLADEGKIPPPPYSEVEYELWLRGFKVAKVLQEWISEVSEDSIYEKYGIAPGDLMNIVETGTWLAYAASKVCQVVNLDKHSRMFMILSKRIEYGVEEDLLDLVRVKGIGRARARTLANAGIRTVKDLLKTPKYKLINLKGFGEKLVEQIIEEAKKLYARS